MVYLMFQHTGYLKAPLESRATKEDDKKINL